MKGVIPKLQSRYLIIINKTSNQGMTKKIWPNIKHELNHYHVKYIATASRYSQNIYLITEEYIKKAKANDILMVIGGDGTLNRVLNSTQKLTQQNSDLPILPIAYLPTGAKNYFARIHHISLNYAKALRQIIFKGKIHQIKIGYFNETIKKNQQYFTHNNEIGFSLASIKAMSRSKFHWHFLKIWWNLIASLYDAESFPLSIYRPNKTTIVKRVLQINIDTYPGLQTKPPYLSLTIFRKYNFFIMLYLVLKLYFQKHLKSKFIYHLKATTFHLGIPTLEYCRIDNENMGSCFYNLYYHFTKYPFIL